MKETQRMAISQAAIIRMTIQDMGNGVLAAASLGMSGFGAIGKQNNAYGPMLEAELIHKNGRPTFEEEDLLLALSHEINERVDRGEFN